MIDYLTLREVLVMHELLLEEFGGTAGVRDRGALESAIMRPQLGYYPTLVAQAAALMESLAQNHPFVDGNKRVAFFATDTFLRLNGHYVDCGNEEAYAFFIDLFERSAFRFEHLVVWLEAHTTALPGAPV